MISLSTNARESLLAHGVTDDLIGVAITMAEAIHAAADDVANDTRDEAFDDSTSRGGLLYRRARNRVLAQFAQNSLVTCDTTDNALHVRYGPTAVSFYSARNGLERPHLTGSKTKERVVDESQLSLELTDTVVLRRLVLMHESALDGLIRIGIGVLANSTTWNWNVGLYDRYADTSASKIDEDRVAYDELPEAELPDMQPRRRDRGLTADE